MKNLADWQWQKKESGKLITDKQKLFISKNGEKRGEEKIIIITEQSLHDL